MKLISRDAAAARHAAQGAYARKLSNRSRVALRVEYAAELADRGQAILAGGPVTRDELVGALLRLRYPATEQAMVTHVLYHDTPGWSACAWCGGEDATDAERAEVEPEDAPLVQRRYVTCCGRMVAANVGATITCSGCHTPRRVQLDPAPVA